MQKQTETALEEEKKHSTVGGILSGHRLLVCLFVYCPTRAKKWAGRCMPGTIASAAYTKIV